MADRDVEVDILARDKTERAAKSAARNFERLRDRAARAQAQIERGNKISDKFAKAMGTVAKTTGRAVAMMSAAVSVVGPLTVGLIAAAKAAAAVGKAVGQAAVGLAPLVAFLPSLAAAAGLLFGTLKLAGPGLAKALRPITAAFIDAEGNAGKLAVRIQNLASKGVEPLAKQFAKVNMPVIGAAMERIAVATNRVVLAVGGWLNSIEGQKVIATIAGATATAMESLAPKVAAAVIALGNLAGRAGDKAITGFADLIGRILDKFTAWADSTSMADINQALKDLSGYLLLVKDKFDAIRQIGKWLGDNEGRVKAFATAVAIVGITLGALTGGWLAIVIGGLSLLLTNFDKVKAAAGRFAEIWKGITSDPNVRGVWDSMKAAWQGFVDSFKKHSEQIGPKFRELVGNLKAAWAEWGPLIKAWWDGVGKPVFSALGAALAIAITWVLEFGTKVATGMQAAGYWFRALWGVVSEVLGNIINGAAKALGWVPGIGPKLKAAADDFNAFRDRVNAALAGIKDQTVVVNVVTRQGLGLGGMGQSRAVGMAAGNAWQPAVWAAAFAAGESFAAGRGGGRVGGPTPVAVEQTVNVLLDGQPFKAIVTTELARSERRQAWRAKTGRR